MAQVKAVVESIRASHRCCAAEFAICLSGCLTSRIQPGCRDALSTLHGIADYEPAQFAGLMGAFGRRVANTEGYDSDLLFFESRWNDNEETWDYRVPDTVREALALEQLV